MRQDYNGPEEVKVEQEQEQTEVYAVVVQLNTRTMADERQGQ